MTNVDEKIALITGITGQDGSYLAEFLLEKGYVVSCALMTIKKVTAIFILLISNKQSFKGSWYCPSFL